MNLCCGREQKEGDVGQGIQNSEAKLCGVLLLDTSPEKSSHRVSSGHGRACQDGIEEHSTVQILKLPLLKAS